jgi:hypothetical protein
MLVEEPRKPWWRNLYLLGLDAPLVAVLWLFLFAKTWRLNYHPWEAYMALFLMVWAMRMAAKLLRSSIHPDPKDPLQIWRKWLVRAAVGASLVAMILVILNFSLSIYLRLLVVAILIIAYFALAIFSSDPKGEISYPKHLFAGVAFAFGTTMMAHVYLTSLTIQDLFRAREFLSFAVLCTIASAAVEHWTRAKQSENPGGQEIWQISLPLTLLGASALVFAVQEDSLITRPYYYCILTGAALLQVLNRTFYRFHISDIKILTSACFLVPGLIFQAYAMSR